MTDDGSISRELLRCLTERFSDRWDIERNGSLLQLRPVKQTHGRPRKRRRPALEIVDSMRQVFGNHGIPSAPLLPIRWGRETDLLISAVQGLDPWLKDGGGQVLREGFLPQPVVRFTGERDQDGRLQDGFLTSFVNLSCVVRIDSARTHVALLDLWIEALSAAGIHAGRLEITGRLETWDRSSVSGITLHIAADGVGFADAVLLWHSVNPSFMATDLGTGLERILWLESGSEWGQTVFGHLAAQFDLDLLDAVRTATLLTMAGIRPSSRGAGAGLRRICQRIPAEIASSGLGRLVATQRTYWAEMGLAGAPWPQLANVIEDEVLRTAG